MTMLAKTLTELMGKNQLTQTDIAQLTGFDKSKVSRIFSSDRPATNESFKTIVHAFPDKEDKLQITAAYLRDALPPEIIAELLDDSSHIRPAGIKHMNHLSKEARAALNYILRARLESPEIEEFLISTAKALGWAPKK